MNLEHLALVITAIAGVLAGLTGFWKAWDSARRFARKDALQSLQEEVARQSAKIDKLEEQNDRLEERNNELARINANLAIQVDNQKAQIDELIEERDKLRIRVDELECTLRNLQAPLPGLDHHTGG